MPSRLSTDSSIHAPDDGSGRKFIIDGGVRTQRSGGGDRALQPQAMEPNQPDEHKVHPHPSLEVASTFCQTCQIALECQCIGSI